MAEPQNLTQRIAVIVDPNLSSGQVANAAAIATAGLRCDAFLPPIRDLSGILHTGIRWNLVILSAKSALHLRELVSQAVLAEASAVVMSSEGLTLSNSYEQYEAMVRDFNADSLHPAALAIYGPHDLVRQLTKRCSLCR